MELQTYNHPQKKGRMIYIDEEVWNSAQEKYPRMVSQLIEDCLIEKLAFTRQMTKEIEALDWKVPNRVSDEARQMVRKALQEAKKKRLEQENDKQERTEEQTSQRKEILKDPEPRVRSDTSKRDDEHKHTGSSTYRDPVSEILARVGTDNK